LPTELSSAGSLKRKMYSMRLKFFIRKNWHWKASRLRRKKEKNCGNDS